MHVISARGIAEFIAAHPDAGPALAEWLAVAQAAAWRSIQEVRRHYPTADAATVRSGGTVTIFNIRGNRYRLITAVHYNRQKVFTLRFLTHAEYDRGRWKDQL